MFGRKSKEIKELEAKIRSLEMDKEWNIIHYHEETQRLEKALDKTCETIFFAQIHKGMTPRNIKEYYLKESEKK